MRIVFAAAATIGTCLVGATSRIVPADDFSPAVYPRNSSRCLFDTSRFAHRHGLSFCAQTPRYVFPLPEHRGLSGTHGEPRHNHFHFGIDIPTGVWGVPVRAAADGYVCRVRTWHDGYGRALFIRHPDGFSTVYGHLEAYMPAVEKRMVAKQKADRLFCQDLFFSPGEFPVKQGQVVGWAGSTGGSSGPHLHYEIRDPQERPLNPLFFHKNDVTDFIPPFFTRIALMPLDAGSRVMGKFDTWSAAPIPEKGQYHTHETLAVKGRIGVLFSAFDRVWGTSNLLGIYKATLKLDHQVVYSHQIDRFSFDDARYVMHHLDYPTLVKEDVFLEKAFVEHGNRMPIYTALVNRGIIELRDDDVHRLELKVEDFHGNGAVWNGCVRRSTEAEMIRYGTGEGVVPTYTLRRNVAVVRHAPPPPAAAVVVEYDDGTHSAFKPAYSDGDYAYTLVPLKVNKLPVRARSAGWPEAMEFYLAAVVVPGRETAFRPKGYENSFRAHFSPWSFFDTVFVEFRSQTPVHPDACSPIFALGDATIPLFRPAALRLFPDRNHERFAPGQIQLIEIRTDGTFNRFSTNGAGATVAKRMGRFCLIGDRTPPTVEPQDFTDGGTLAPGAQKITFLAKDDIAEVNPYAVHCHLDGNWVVGEYYDFTGLLIHRFERPPAPGKHVFSVFLTDYAGNAVQKQFSFFVEH
jgi:hypothetical protein